MHLTGLPWIMVSPGKIRFSEVGSKHKQPTEQALMAQAVAICLYYVPIYQGFSTCDNNESNVY